MFQELVEGKIDQLIALIEKLLSGLSNRDYAQSKKRDCGRFDEKYIKVVMLSLLSDVKIYIPHSEYEVGADGYVDVYLQPAFEPQTSTHYFIELKYAKARATQHTLDAKEHEGVQAMSAYLQSDAAKAATPLQAYVLVFKKDHCVRKVLCS